MLDYLFQHFYSTLAILAFLIVILFLHEYGKRSSKWIPGRTAPFGCLAFIFLFILLTFLTSCLLSAFRAGEFWEETAFILAWLLALWGAFSVIAWLTRHYMRRESFADTPDPAENRATLATRLRNKGICWFLIIGLLGCVIDILTVPLPAPELAPGSPFATSTIIPLPDKEPLEIRISSRVTNKFFGGCDFDLTVRDQQGRKHIFPSILLNPGGGRAITIYRLRPADGKKDGSLVFTNEMQSCLLNLDTMKMKSLNGPASNYPYPTREDLHGPDIENRLETVGLYRGQSCRPGMEYSRETRANLLKNLKEVQP